MNYLVKVYADYQESMKLRELSNEQYEVFYNKYGDYFNLSNPRTQYESFIETFVPLSVFEELQADGWNVHITKVKGLSYDKDFDNRIYNSTESPKTITNITQVTVANEKLLTITEVTWLEDACTQELQGRLNEGWRILAVCPSNDQRRPDYILGK